MTASASPQFKMPPPEALENRKPLTHRANGLLERTVYIMTEHGQMQTFIVHRIEAAVQEALKTPEIEKQYAALQLIIMFETSAQLAPAWPKDEAKFRQVIDRLGLAHEQQKKESKN